MKAVIYARYSSDNQREESIEGQIRECTAFAEKNGITILRHYIDRAFSAKTDNRPEFQNMIKDSGKRLFDMIIVWKLDRFARNRYDSARYKATLKKNGVKVVSATEVISDGAEGIILESVLEGYAEYYSADLSEKVVRGMTENALKSKYNGGTRPIGYLIDSDQCFQLDPLTAPFVREAFQRYDEGATMTQIRDWLNEQGVKNTRGQKMTYNSVQHLLNNRRYIGEYTYRDIVVPDGIPAIVPQDLFDRVQEKLAKNKKAPARHKAEDDYLLTTKLFCGYCGAYLCGESGTSHTGNVHHYYKCVSVKKKRTECHKKSVRKEWIEDLVVSETMKMVMDDIIAPLSATILINVDGTAIQYGSYQIFRNGTAATRENARLILWNFPQALTWSNSTTAIYGSVLAPFAAANTTFSQINGNIIFDSFSGNAESHNELFIGDLPEAMLCLLTTTSSTTSTTTTSTTTTSTTTSTTTTSTTTTSTTTTSTTTTSTTTTSTTTTSTTTTSTTTTSTTTTSTTTTQAPIPRSQAITDLLLSVALQQAALSHILNAEGEKVQKILSFDQLTPETILKTNRSVESMVNNISNLEVILAEKVALFKGCNCSGTGK